MNINQKINRIKKVCWEAVWSKRELSFSDSIIDLVYFKVDDLVKDGVIEILFKEYEY